MGKKVYILYIFIQSFIYSIIFKSKLIKPNQIKSNHKYNHQQQQQEKKTNRIESKSYPHNLMKWAKISEHRKRKKIAMNHDDDYKGDD